MNVKRGTYTRLRRRLFLLFLDNFAVVLYYWTLQYKHNTCTLSVKINITRLTRRVSLVEQQLLTLPEHLSSLPSPAYGVYISQLIRYARASSNYSDFLKRHLHLTNRLLDQGYAKIRLNRALKKFIFRYQDLVEIYSVYAEKIINDGFSHSKNV